MESSIQKVLFVNSEMLPYLPETRIAKVSRELAPGIQDRKHEIRSFMPRYGCINERKHQLHEVIRLSGMNLIISDVDRPLVIKVASISAARMQVYFIDNDDYFSRRQTARSEDGIFFPDNDERAIFYARGVLETVKKLRWAPDIIHCSGWISHLLPVYLKKIYKDDPIFAGSRVVLSLYGDSGRDAFNPDFRKKVTGGNIAPEDLPFLENPTGIELAKTAVQYSDGVIFGSPDVDAELVGFCRQEGKKTLTCDESSFEDGRYISEYNDFYEKLFDEA